MRFVVTSARLDPNETLEEYAARMERLRQLREGGDPLANRIQIGTVPCRCGGRMRVFEFDPRARGWLREECPSCGEWGDMEPEERAAVVAGEQ